MPTIAAPQLSAMAQLRAATRAQHESLDHDCRLAKKLQSIEGLTWLLRRWYGFYLPYESQLEQSTLRWRGLAQERRKSHLLLADLRNLGVTAGSIAVCKNIPVLLDDNEVLGSMYVTEGATLGGCFIARQLERQLRLSQGRGYSFFNGYGEQTGQMWREFAAIVNENCLANPEPVITAARKTFQCIHEWLTSE